MDSGSKDTAELKEKLEGKVSLTTKRNTESVEIEKRLSEAGLEIAGDFLCASEEMLFIDS